jgi:outer membrane protein OmpA-like peptidoglycan-associated protein
MLLIKCTYPTDFEQHFVYTQEGDRFSIHSEPLPHTKEVTVSDVEKNPYLCFGTYPYDTRYTFPFDVKTVNNPNSSRENSRNKVHLQYPGQFFYQPDIADVVINSLGDLYISFAINSSVITPDEASKIEQLAAYLKANPYVSVTVQGSADYTTGSVKYNRKLSSDRAAAVVKLLHEYGISGYDYSRGINRISIGSQYEMYPPLFPSDKENRCVIILLREVRRLNFYVQ